MRFYGCPAEEGGAGGASGGYGAVGAEVVAGGESKEFRVYTGNSHRNVRDLEVWGGVGQHSLAFERIYNSRYANPTRWLGQAGWRHSYQWEFAWSYYGLIITYPDGSEIKYVDNYDGTWRSTAAVTDRLVNSGDNFTLKTQHGWQYHILRQSSGYYSYTFKMTGFSDAYDNYYGFSYDGSNRLTNVTEQAGRSLTLNYGTNGYLTNVVASDGRKVTFAYGTFTGNQGDTYTVLTNAAYGDATSATYTYTQQHNYTLPLLATADDPRHPGAAVKVGNTYNTSPGAAWGFIWKQYNPVNSNAVATLTNEMVTFHTGGVSDYRFQGYWGQDPGSQPSLRVDSYLQTNAWFYDNNNSGYLTRSQNPFQRETFYTNSTHGNLTGITHPNGDWEAITRNSREQVLTHRNRLGYWTTNTLDSRNRITRIDHPDGSYETFTYNTNSQVLTHRLRSGGTNTYGYGTNGLLLAATNALGAVTTFGYNTNDLPSHVTNALGQVTVTTYNERGLPTKVTHPDNNWIGFGYDAYGNKTSQTNELGKVWTWAYNERRQIISAVDPLNRTNSTHYNELGQPVRTVSPRGITNAFGYDLERRLSSVTNAWGTSDAAVERYEYDAVGNRTNRVDALGQSWKAYYNNLNQVTNVTDPLGNVTSFTYDTAGNKLTERRPDGGDEPVGV